MPRTKNPDRPHELRVCIPTSLAERMDKYLHSELEDGVPYGARAELVRTLLVKYLDIVAPEEVE